MNSTCPPVHPSGRVPTRRAAAAVSLLPATFAPLVTAVLGDYVRPYNEARPHRGRQLATSLPLHDQPRIGEICPRNILDGMIHEYDRAA